MMTLLRTPICNTMAMFVCLCLSLLVLLDPVSAVSASVGVDPDSSRSADEAEDAVAHEAKRAMYIPVYRYNTNNNNDNDEEEDDDENNNNGDDDNDGRAKRVFCNGFTGCGGRHRSGSRWRRRRVLAARKRLIPVLVKRPLCTSRSCLQNPSRATRPDDAGSKASFVRSQLSSANRAAGAGGKGIGRLLRLSRPVQPGVLAKILEAAALASAVRGEGGGSRVGPGTGTSGRAPPVEAGKRLFCNGYGGCRGKKRSLFSPWMSRMNSVADSL